MSTYKWLFSRSGVRHMGRRAGDHSDREFGHAGDSGSDQSDRPVTVSGRWFLLVVLTPAQAHDDDHKSSGAPVLWAGRRAVWPAAGWDSPRRWASPVSAVRREDI